MEGSKVDYQVGELRMVGRLFRPRHLTGQRPAVLVFPEAFGPTEHALGRAERLAAAGYIALACDLHGGGRLVYEREERMAIVLPLLGDAARMRLHTGGALEALRSQPDVDPTRIAAIGFCLGGTMALELACSGADLKAAVGFHCGLSMLSMDEAAAIRGKLLVCLGDIDPSVPPQDRATFEAALRRTEVDWQMHLYGGVLHGFTNPGVDALGMPEFARYDAAADARSWASMSSLLEDVLRDEADGVGRST